MRKYEGTISWHHEGDKESLKTYKISIEEEKISSHRSNNQLINHISTQLIAIWNSQSQSPSSPPWWASLLPSKWKTGRSFVQNSMRPTRFCTNLSQMEFQFGNFQWKNYCGSGVRFEMASNMDVTSPSNQQQSNASDLPEEVDQSFAKTDSKLKNLKKTSSHHCCNRL